MRHPRPCPCPRKKKQLVTFAFIFTSIACLTHTAPSGAGVIRHGVSDDHYQQLAEHFSAVGQVEAQSPSSTSLGSGTLIANNWVLTAAHVVNGDTHHFLHNGQRHNVKRAVIHPEWDGNIYHGHDLALLELSSPLLGVSPAPMATTNAIGRVTTLVGFGRTGTGLHGQTQAGGTKRAGQNTLDARGKDFFPLLDNSLMMVDFDYPFPMEAALPSNQALGGTDIPTMLTGSTHINRMGDADPLPLEYLPAAGDSGGAAFMEVNGQSLLAGVISMNMAWDGSNNASYTDMAGIVDITDQHNWIVSTIPEPTTALCLLTASTGLLHRRRSS